ncbi:MAG: Ku protein, partial [Verrucomicrobiota bacterium]
AKGGERAYALLRETMRKSGRVAVAQVVLRQSQHLAAVTPVGDALVFTTLRFAHQVIDARELSLPAAKSLNPHEMELAAKLVDGFADRWKPEQYHDKYTENLLAIIKTKTRKGGVPRLGELAPAAPTGEITDLMERLRASLAHGRRGAQPGSAKVAPARKRGKARGHRHAA